jgi:hypothetical protein
VGKPWVGVKGEQIVVELALSAVEGVRHRNFCARSAAFRPRKPKPGLAGSSCARVCDARKDLVPMLYGPTSQPSIRCAHLG